MAQTSSGKFSVRGSLHSSLADADVSCMPRSATVAADRSRRHVRSPIKEIAILAHFRERMQRKSAALRPPRKLTAGQEQTAVPRKSSPTSACAAPWGTGSNCCAALAATAAYSAHGLSHPRKNSSLLVGAVSASVRLCSAYQTVHRETIIHPFTPTTDADMGQLPCWISWR